MIQCYRVYGNGCWLCSSLKSYPWVIGLNPLGDGGIISWKTRFILSTWGMWLGPFNLEMQPT